VAQALKGAADQQQDQKPQQKQKQTPQKTLFRAACLKLRRHRTPAVRTTSIHRTNASYANKQFPAWLADL